MAGRCACVLDGGENGRTQMRRGKRGGGGGGEGRGGGGERWGGGESGNRWYVSPASLSPAPLIPSSYQPNWSNEKMRMRNKLGWRDRYLQNLKLSLTVEWPTHSQCENSFYIQCIPDVMHISFIISSEHELSMQQEADDRTHVQNNIYPTYQRVREWQIFKKLIYGSQGRF